MEKTKTFESIDGAVPTGEGLKHFYIELGPFSVRVAGVHKVEAEESARKLIDNNKGWGFDTLFLDLPVVVARNFTNFGAPAGENATLMGIRKPDLNVPNQHDQSDSVMATLKHPDQLEFFATRFARTPSEDNEYLINDAVISA